MRRDTLFVTLVLKPKFASLLIVNNQVKYLTFMVVRVVTVQRTSLVWM